MTKLVQSALLPTMLLLSLCAAAQTVPSTVTNATGNPDQGATYHQMASPTASSADVQNSDVAPKAKFQRATPTGLQSTQDPTKDTSAVEATQETKPVAAQQQLQQQKRAGDTRPGRGLWSTLLGFADRQWSRSTVGRPEASHP